MQGYQFPMAVIRSVEAVTAFGQTMMQTCMNKTCIKSNMD
jgi:hypothetical protein